MTEETIQCWSCGTQMTLEELSSNDGDCPECEVEIALAEYLARALAENAELRAQPPSQGGWAVAEHQQLSRYRNWERIDKVDFDLGMLGSCPEKFRALYTHPADQVADDLTMVKVPRELPAWLDDKHALGEKLYSIGWRGLADAQYCGAERLLEELRALLAKSEGVKNP